MKNEINKSIGKMKFLGFGVLALIVVGLVFLSGCVEQKSPDNTNTTNTNTNTTPQTLPAPTPPSSTNQTQQTPPQIPTTPPSGTNQTQQTPPSGTNQTTQTPPQAPPTGTNQTTQTRPTPPETISPAPPAPPAVITNNTNSNSTANEGNANPSNPTPPQMAKIIMHDFTFEPDTLTVPVGTKVVWMNADLVEHTVKAEGLFESPAIKSGGTFEYTFTKKGTFGYICGIHPSMKGKIIVQ